MERWVTFDCFGTLADWHSGFSAAIQRFAGERTGELLRAYHEFEPAVEAERPHRLYREVLSESLLRAAQKLNINLSRVQAASLPESWEALPLFPDTEEMLAEHLAMAYAPEPDLFIRTGGEERISNFLLWQLAYSELYFTDTFWPDFSPDSLDTAIASYQSRERRFGRTGEQVANKAKQG